MATLFGINNCVRFVGGLWEWLDSVTSFLWSALGDILVTLIFLMFKFVLNIVDLIQFVLKKLVGLDYWGTNKVSLDTLGESDIIFKFLFSEPVQTAFRYMIVVFVVLVIVFTIIAIIKSEYDVAATGDIKKSSKVPHMRAALRSIAIVVLVPIMLILGILSSNAILSSLVNALNVSNDLTIGSQIFTVSAYGSSRYRLYADTNKRYSATNLVNVTYDSELDDDDTYYTYGVLSGLDIIVPNKFTSSNPFNGLYFRLNDENYLMLVDRNVTTPIKYEAYEGDEARGLEAYDTKVEAYSQYLRQYLGATNIEVVENLNLNAQGSDSKYIKAAYNTWDYNNEYDQNKAFEDTISYYSGKFNSFGLNHSAVRYPTNTESWGALHDGGVAKLENVGGEYVVLEGGNYSYTPIRDEYYVMADIQDFILSEGVEMSFVNSADPRINWTYYGTQTNLGNFLGSSVGNQTQIDRFLVDYTLSGKIGYNSNFHGSSEADGAVFIMCYTDPNTGLFVPVVNRQTFIDNEGNTHTFSSDYLAPSYNGIIIARGMLYDEMQNSYGYPTIISSVYSNDREGIAGAKDEEYYLKSSSMQGYSYFSKHKDYELKLGTDYLAESGGGYSLVYKNAFTGINSYDATDLSTYNPDNPQWEELTTRIIDSLPTKFRASWVNEIDSAGNVVYASTNAVGGGTISLENFDVNIENEHEYWKALGLQVIGGVNYAIFGYTNLEFFSEAVSWNLARIFVNLDKLADESEPSFEFFFASSPGYFSGTKLVDSIDEITDGVAPGSPVNRVAIFKSSVAYSNYTVRFADNRDYQGVDNSGRCFVAGTQNLGLGTDGSGNIYNDFTIVSHDVLKVPVGPDSALLINYVSGEGMPNVGNDYEGSIIYNADNSFTYMFQYDGTGAREDDITLSLAFDRLGKLVSAQAYDMYKLEFRGKNTDGSLTAGNIVFAENDQYEQYFTLQDMKFVSSNHQGHADEVVYSWTYGGATYYSRFIENVDGYESYDLVSESGGQPLLYDMAYTVFNTYNVLTVINEATGEMLMYDPDLGVYYNNNDVYIIDSDGNVFSYNAHQIPDNVDGVPFTYEDVNRADEAERLKESFLPLKSYNYVISANQLEISETAYVGVAVKNGTDIYDRYTVEYLIFNGKNGQNDDASYVARANSYIDILRDDPNQKQSFPTVLNASMIAELINNNNAFVLGGKSFNTVPVYDLQTINASFTKFSQVIYFTHSNVVSSPFNLDISLKNLLQGEARFKLKLFATNKPDEQVVLKLDFGTLDLSYNLPTTDSISSPSFVRMYVPHKFNFIVFVFASILVAHVLFTAIWGLISRIYEITLYFIVLPGVAAAIPIKPGLWDNWRKTMVNKVLGAYGVILGLNLFFLLIPPIKEASQIFTAADLDTLNLLWIPGELKAKYLNMLIYLVFLLVALSMIKTLPGLVSGIMDNKEDVYDKGLKTRENVKKSISAVQQQVSGAAVMEFAKNTGDLMKDFVPGSAIYKAYEAKRAEKKKKEDEKYKAAAEAKARQEAGDKASAAEGKLRTGFVPGAPRGENQPEAQNNQNAENQQAASGLENIDAGDIKEMGNDARDAVDTANQMQDELANNISEQVEQGVNNEGLEYATDVYTARFNPEDEDNALNVYRELDNEAEELIKQQQQAGKDGDTEKYKELAVQIADARNFQAFIAGQYNALDENGNVDTARMDEVLSKRDDIASSVQAQTDADIDVMRAQGDLDVARIKEIDAQAKLNNLTELKMNAIINNEDQDVINGYEEERKKAEEARDQCVIDREEKEAALEAAKNKQGQIAGASSFNLVALKTNTLTMGEVQEQEEIADNARKEINNIDKEIKADKLDDAKKEFEAQKQGLSKEVVGIEGDAENKIEMFNRFADENKSEEDIKKAALEKGLSKEEADKVSQQYAEYREADKKNDLFSEISEKIKELQAQINDIKAGKKSRIDKIDNEIKENGLAQAQEAYDKQVASLKGNVVGEQNAYDLFEKFAGENKSHEDMLAHAQSIGLDENKAESLAKNFDLYVKRKNDKDRFNELSSQKATLEQESVDETMPLSKSIDEHKQRIKDEGLEKADKQFRRLENTLRHDSVGVKDTAENKLEKFEEYAGKNLTENEVKDKLLKKGMSEEQAESVAKEYEQFAQNKSKAERFDELSQKRQEAVARRDNAENIIDEDREIKDEYIKNNPQPTKTIKFDSSEDKGSTASQSTNTISYSSGVIKASTQRLAEIDKLIADEALDKANEDYQKSQAELSKEKIRLSMRADSKSESKLDFFKRNDGLGKNAEEVKQEVLARGINPETAESIAQEYAKFAEDRAKAGKFAVLTNEKNNLSAVKEQAEANYFNQSGGKAQQYIGNIVGDTENSAIELYNNAGKELTELKEKRDRAQETYELYGRDEDKQVLDDFNDQISEKELIRNNVASVYGAVNQDGSINEAIMNSVNEKYNTFAQSVALKDGADKKVADSKAAFEKALADAIANQEKISNMEKEGVNLGGEEAVRHARRISHLKDEQTRLDMDADRKNAEYKAAQQERADIQKAASFDYVAYLTNTMTNMQMQAKQTEQAELINLIKQNERTLTTGKQKYDDFNALASKLAFEKVGAKGNEVNKLSHYNDAILSDTLREKFVNGTDIDYKGLKQYAKDNNLDRKKLEDLVKFDTNKRLHSKIDNAGMGAEYLLYKQSKENAAKYLNNKAEQDGLIARRDALTKEISKDFETKNAYVDKTQGKVPEKGTSNDAPVKGKGSQSVNSSGTSTPAGVSPETKQAAEEAKFYAEIAKDFADVAKDWANINSGKLPNYTKRELGLVKETRKERKRQRLIDEENAATDRQEQGKGGERTKKKEREDAYAEYNKQNPDKLIFNPNDASVREAALKKLQSSYKPPKPNENLIKSRVDSIVNNKTANMKYLINVALEHNKNAKNDEDKIDIKKMGTLTDDNANRDKLRAAVEKQVAFEHKVENQLVEKESPEYMRAVLAHHNLNAIDKNRVANPSSMSKADFDKAAKAYEAHKVAVTNKAVEDYRDETIMKEWGKKHPDKKITETMSATEKAAVLQQAREEFAVTQEVRKREAENNYVSGNRRKKIKNLSSEIEVQNERIDKRQEFMDEFNKKGAIGKIVTVAGLGVKVAGKGVKAFARKKNEKDDAKDILKAENLEKKVQELTAQKEDLEKLSAAAVNRKITVEERDKFIKDYNKKAKAAAKKKGETAPENAFAGLSQAQQMAALKEAKMKALGKEISEAKDQAVIANTIKNYKGAGVIPRVTQIIRANRNLKLVKSGKIVPEKKVKVKADTSADYVPTKGDKKNAQKYSTKKKETAKEAKVLVEKVSKAKAEQNKAKAAYNAADPKKRKEYRDAEKKYKKATITLAEAENARDKALNKISKLHLKEQRYAPTQSGETKAGIAEKIEKRQSFIAARKTAVKSGVVYETRPKQAKSSTKPKKAKTTSPKVSKPAEEPKVKVPSKKKRINDASNANLAAKAGERRRKISEAVDSGQKEGREKIIREKEIHEKVQEHRIETIQVVYKTDLDKILNSSAVKKFGNTTVKEASKLTMKQAAAEAKKIKTNLLAELARIEESVAKQTATQAEIKAQKSINAQIKKLETLENDLSKASTKAKIDGGKETVKTKEVSKNKNTKKSTSSSPLED